MKNIRILDVLQNKQKPHIYFIGIGGKGLNGIAKYCLKKGWSVTGTDLSFNSEIAQLRLLGAKIFHTHNYSNIKSDVDLVVYSSIIKKDNPEILSAKDKKIPTITRSRFLGALMRQHNTRISVAGSHGKSTTTALCGLGLLYSDLDPTIFGGAYVKEINAYERVGGGRFVIAEACEYAESFYDLVSDISIITSIEKSHMEYYKTEDKMFDAFKKFISLHTSDQLIIVNGDDENIRECIKVSKARVETFGFDEKNTYVMKNSISHTYGSSFDLYYKDTCIAKNLSTCLPGGYNMYNFATVAVLMHVLDLPLDPVFRMGREFQGVGRRFEIVPADKNHIFIDDFCHHPTQVKNLFEGIRQFFPNKKVCAIFQPRQFHLMRTFLKEYGESFKYADSVVVTDIVPALGDTEKDKKSLVSGDLIDSIKKYSNKNEVFYMPNFSEIVESISSKNKDDWIIATIGAGDIYKIRDMYIQKVNQY